MGTLDNRQTMVEDISNITFYFKSGRKSLYRNVKVVEVYKDSIGLEWLALYWETKSYRDTIRILLNTLDEIHYVEDLSKFANQRMEMSEKGRKE